MRLDKKEITIIKNLTQKYFGKEAQVYLFGSRTDNTKKGGDIDLFVESKTEINKAYQRRIQFLSELEISIGLQKIDLVIDRTIERNSAFYKTIIETAIRL